jgi:hypothetical protein
MSEDTTRPEAIPDSLGVRDRIDIAYVAHLARIEMGADEMAKMSAQLKDPVLRGQAQ